MKDRITKLNARLILCLVCLLFFGAIVTALMRDQKHHSSAPRVSETQAITIVSNMLWSKDGWPQRASFHAKFDSGRWMVIASGGPTGTNSSGHPEWTIGDHVLVEVTPDGVVTNFVGGR